MKYFKINNLLNEFNQPDYKGFDIDKFVVGSQVYAQDFSYCLIATTEEDAIKHDDIAELTHTQYVEEKNRIKSEKVIENETTDKKIENLHNENKELKLAVAESLEKQEKDKTELQLVIAQLIEKNGGVA